MSEIDDLDLALRCHEMSEIALRARDILNPRLVDLGKASHVYTYKSRVKTPGGVLAKVQRKKSERPSSPDDDADCYEPDHVTDAWGCRFVTLYQSQIPPTVGEMLADFDKFNRTSQDKIELVEFVVYTNRPDKDPLSIVNETLDVLKASELFRTMRSAESVRKPENRKSAYSSVHLVFALPVTVEHVRRGATRETARFEVQVRDIFEEGWGEIQHNLIYSDKDRPKVPAEADASFDPLWQPHLNALKTFVDGCSQHASIIKSTYDFIQLRSMPSIETKSATSQTTDRDAIIAALKPVASASAIRTVEGAYSLLLAAHEDGSQDEARTNYLSAAVRFGESIEGLADLISTPVTARFDREVGYFLRIEQGNCFHQSKIVREQQKSIPIYESLVQDYPEDATATLRLAIALAVDKTNEEVLGRAIDLINHAVSLIPDDPLTGEAHWIAISCNVHLGYLSWLLADARDKKANREEAVNYIRKAISYTISAYDLWKAFDDKIQKDDTYILLAHKALSNLLFYLAKFRSFDPSSNEFDKSFIENAVSDLEGLEVPKYREYYKTRDNIMHALDAIGRRDGARQYARDNVNELKKFAETRARRQLKSTEVEDFLTDDERRNYRTAAAVLADQDGSA